MIVCFCFLEKLMRLFLLLILYVYTECKDIYILYAEYEDILRIKI